MGNSNEVAPADVKSVWGLLKETYSRWSEVNAPRLGAALAYYTVLSLAPLLVVVVAIGGLAFGREAAEGQIRWQFQDLIGAEGALAIQAMLQHAAKPAAGIAAGLLGMIALLFGASGVFGELRDSLNIIWGVKHTAGGGLTGMLRYRFLSFAMVLGIGFLLLVSLVISAGVAAAGKYFGHFLPIPEVLLHLINLLVSFAVITVLFALIYKVVPDVQIEWYDVWIGSAVTALLFSLGKFLIGFYLGKTGVGSAYGAAGSIVIVLAWMYYSAQVFFLGAEFTHTFAERHGSRAEARVQAAEPAKVKPFRNPRLA